MSEKLNFDAQEKTDKRGENEYTWPNPLKGIIASPGQRILSRILDELILMLILLPAEIWVYGEYILKLDEIDLAFFTTPKYIFYAILSNLVWIILYIVVPIKLKGQTIGKRSTNTRIIKRDGTPASSRSIAVRYGLLLMVRIIVSTILRGIGIGAFWHVSFICLLATEDRQALHDMFSGTVVVQDKQYQY